MVFLTNTPVEDAAGREADKSLRLPRGMFTLLNAKPDQPERGIFPWGYTQRIILGILTIFLCLFFSHALI